ncbi:MAG TPA: VOC family protein [Candidatus Dormibacteraeota bacterium]|nr:VOC family protein [Candidatus Dormibacteraeota bacterium]
MTNTSVSKPSIAAATGVGAVHLAVTDGAVASRFYVDTLGLTPMASEGDVVRFGAGGRELVVLHPGASGPVAPHTTGLYHLAILLPSRHELARMIARATRQRYPNSPTDHTLTKSDYLWDPDGNGIEVYAESPEDGTWTFVDDGFGVIDSQGASGQGGTPSTSRSSSHCCVRMTTSTSPFRPAPGWAMSTCTSATSPTPWTSIPGS